LIERLKEESRQRYLGQRETQQLEMLRARIETEGELFLGQQQEQCLTEAEEGRLRLDRQIFEIAQERRRQAEYVPQVYQMPERQRNLQPEARPDASGVRGSENAAWEATQLAKMSAQTCDADDDSYEFVEEPVEASDFLPGAQLEGTDELPIVPVPVLSKGEQMQETRRSLPIFAYREELLEAIEVHQILIVVGETGSGKTTQLPQYLHEAGYTKDGLRIGCTQPRRVAAMSVAARVAEETGTRLGHEIGYSVRFEDCTSSRTRIKYMTDGMLLREVLETPDLPAYGVLIVDEAHERTLHTDILLGLLKDLAALRPTLKLIIASATLDAERFSDYFGGAPIFTIPGRRYPVDILYTRAPEADYLAAALATCMQIHLTQPLPGDILLFLTGQEEIETVQENLSLLTRRLGKHAPELILAPIYAALPADLQAAIFRPTPPRARKLVLATNIAETSITIDGIAYVVDPGFAKINVYNARTGVESLLVTPCSQASAQQRAGRAGRVGPGKCFRLYTAWAFTHELPAVSPPEITRCNLASVLLLLKTLGIHDLLAFDFLDRPSPQALIKALEQLYALGALNDRGELTRTGRRMAEFPLDPMMARALLASEEHGCSEEMASIMAMLSVQGSLFYRPKDRRVQADAARKALSHPGGDHLTLLAIWQAWEEAGFSGAWCYDNFLQLRSMKRAKDVREQLVSLMARVEIPLKSCSSDGTAIQKAILAGYFPHAARLQSPGDAYKVAGRKQEQHFQPIHVHPSSALFGSDPKPAWVIYHELVLTAKEYMRQIMQIQPEWLLQAAPHYYQPADIAEDGPTARRTHHSKAIGRPALV